MLDVHPKLQKIFYEVVKHFDCSVIEGRRLKAAQDDAYHSGRSKVKWPNSKHNPIPSQAIDVIPYPVDWNDKDRFMVFGGFVKGIATSMGIKIRWGGDWDSDNDFHDQTFNDYPHFELHPDELVKQTNVLPNGPTDDDITNKLKSTE